MKACYHTVCSVQNAPIFRACMVDDLWHIWHLFSMEQARRRNYLHSLINISHTKHHNKLQSPLLHTRFPLTHAPIYIIAIIMWNS